MTAALVLALSVVSTLSAGAAVGDRHWRAHVRGTGLLVLVNLLALPVAAWALGRALDLGGAGAGLVIAAAAPGGSTGPLLSLLSRGDEGVAAALFAVLTVAGTVTALGATLVFDVAGVGSVARAAAIVTAVSLAPLFVGVIVRVRRPALAAAMARWLSRLGALLLLATVVALAMQHGGDLAGAGALAASAALLVASALPALVLAARARRVAAAQVALVRNLTLALVVLTAVSAPPSAVGAVLSFGLVMYVLAVALAVVTRLRSGAGA